MTDRDLLGCLKDISVHLGVLESNKRILHIVFVKEEWHVKWRTRCYLQLFCRSKPIFNEGSHMLVLLPKRTEHDDAGYGGSSIQMISRLQLLKLPKWEENCNYFHQPKKAITTGISGEWLLFGPMHPNSSSSASRLTIDYSLHPKL